MIAPNRVLAETSPVEMSEEQFALPSRHRLVFTEDAFGNNWDAVRELFECDPGGQPARVQIWADAEVLRTNEGLESVLNERFGARSGFECSGIFACPGGESVKNDWSHVERMLAAIDAASLDRRSYITVIGGGAVLDAVGFAAATAHRGIRLIRFPTTTLAQADSGVGVKNAVNRFGKKNWLGTFAVPWAVVNDATLLQTLPDSHYRSGFSEAVKVALLKSPAAFARLSRDAVAIRQREPRASASAIRESALLHLHHITRGGDPFELLEARPLDFGHWSAHRLEAMSGYTVSHGDAVSIGVALDSVYSSLVLGFADRDCQRVITLLQSLQLPVFHPLIGETSALFEGLEQFRQHLGGRLTVTMLRGIGDPIDVHEIDYSAMRRSIELLSQVSATREQMEAGQPGE